jgi:hypothetical protein
MTEHRNPLMDRPRNTGSLAAFVTVEGQQVPTEIHDYCGWLNARERRSGMWTVIQAGDRKTVEWRAHVASPDWVRERGMIPKIGRAA